MDELEKGLKIGMTGDLRDEALAKFAKQMTEWDITMPPVAPLVLDFGLGEFYKTGLIEHWIANEVDAGYCGKYLFVFDGQTCPAHHHKEKMETFFIVKGRVRMALHDKEREMKAGDVLPVMPEQKHSFTGLGSALLLELSKPCLIADNYFENSRISIGKKADGGQ